VTAVPLPVGVLVHCALNGEGHDHPATHALPFWAGVPGTLRRVAGTWVLPVCDRWAEADQEEAT